jgi:hypothetical protein
VAEKKCNKIALVLRKKGEIIKDKSESSNKLYIDPDKKENEEFYRERVEARYGGKNGSSRCC